MNVARMPGIALMLLTAACGAVFHSGGCAAGSRDGHAGVGGAAGGEPGSGGDGVGGWATGGACPPSCSLDLRDVIDCHGAVVQTCPPDRGCGADGSCVSACESAEQNGSSVGCEFFAAAPGPELQTRGGCFAAMLANTWVEPITITASFADSTLDVDGMTRRVVGSGVNLAYAPLANGVLEPGQIAIVFLSHHDSGEPYNVACPDGITPGLEIDPSLDGNGWGHAFHLATSAPVVAYDVFPYGGAASFVSSATLLIPTPAWGLNYVASDGYRADPYLAWLNGFPFVQVVAAEDDTVVTINPSAAIAAGGGIDASAAGQPVSYSLQRGELLQLMQAEELAGSAIEADKPIGVWGGSGCMNIPLGVESCDSAHQQLPPIAALGHEYLGLRHRDRVQGAGEVIPYTLVGAVDGTELSYEPLTPPGAPTSLHAGEVVELATSQRFFVTSQDADHPFAFAAHMTGASAVFGNAEHHGDPDYVNVIPPAQFLSRYVFLTDPTYANTHLVVARAEDASGVLHDVTLDCLGTVSGWKDVTGDGRYQWAAVDLVIDGVAQGSCDNGVQVAESDAPFGVTVWGWDTAVSYAYPAGMGVRSINQAVFPSVPR